MPKTEQSVVYRYTSDGLRIEEDESVWKESTGSKDGDGLAVSADARTDAFSGRWQWDSAELERDEALAYNRVRCFDPTIGRWINGDPLGFESGDANCYRYISPMPGEAIPPGE
ncbi:MAG TPA: RHS repeat-associated core domain-containing protein [Gemmataceae bacterium]|nr:RHS repeat-associated core domain-containing protein [Gemmataceae bacterium]